jgi:hypothetical protein
MISLKRVLILISVYPVLLNDLYIIAKEDDSMVEMRVQF